MDSKEKKYIDRASDFRDLISKIQSGDTKAFDILYKECVSKIYRYVYFRLGADIARKQLAEDITQETFLKTYQAIKDSKIDTERGSPLSYIYTVARNLIIDNSRKRKEELFAEDKDADDYIENDQNPISDAEVREMSKHAIEAIYKLPEAIQEVFIFYYINDYSTEEICSITGKTPEAIRKLKSRGLTLLRYIIREQYGENN